MDNHPHNTPDADPAPRPDDPSARPTDDTPPSAEPSAHGTSSQPNGTSSRPHGTSSQPEEPSTRPDRTSTRSDGPSNRPDTSEDLTKPAAQGRTSWRVVDIVVAAVLGVACGLIFYGWNSLGYAWYEAMDALTPGLGGIAAGVWYLGGPLGGLVIRKPGAALLVELVAGFVSMALGNQWGWTTMYSAFAQGIGAEIVFAIFAYRRFGAVVGVLAGMLAGAGAWTCEYLLSNHAKSGAFNVIYLVTNLVTGAVLAGLLAWLLMKALAKTGALDRFASGRSSRAEV